MDGAFRETLSRIRKATQEMALGYFFPHMKQEAQLNYLLDLELWISRKVNRMSFKSHISTLKVPLVLEDMV